MTDYRDIFLRADDEDAAKRAASDMEAAFGDALLSGGEWRPAGYQAGAGGWSINRIRNGGWSATPERNNRGEITTQGTRHAGFFLRIRIRVGRNTGRLIAAANRAGLSTASSVEAGR